VVVEERRGLLVVDWRGLQMVVVVVDERGLQIAVVVVEERRDLLMVDWRGLQMVVVVERRRSARNPPSRKRGGRSLRMCFKDAQ
jgi:hypothetical protein